MNLVGLQGFSHLGRIDQYFRHDGDTFFPRDFNWRKDEWHYVEQLYSSRFGAAEYLLVCFSDGGTVGHMLAQNDPRCRGIIAHSASCPLMVSDLARDVPTLILYSLWDLTGMGWRSARTVNWLERQGMTKVESQKIPTTTWHSHEFPAGLAAMQEWALLRFGKSLPIL